MIKSKEAIETRGIEIDLTGPRGNAFFLLGTASNLAKQHSVFKRGDSRTSRRNER